MEKPDFLNDEGTQFLKEGKISEAIEIFKRLTKRFPKDPLYWNNLGFAQFLQGKNDEALHSINKALLFDPKFLGALQNKGQLLCRIERFDDAVKILTEAKKIDSSSIETYTLLGMAFRNQGNHIESINCYNHILKDHPDHADSWNNLSNSLRYLRKYCESYKAIKKAIQLKPDSFEAWSNYSIILRHYGCYEEGLKAVEKAIALNPNSANSWSNKGNILRELGRSAEAIECYDKAIEIDGNNFIAWNNKGSALHDLGRIDEAINCFDISIKRNPDFSDGLANRGIGYLNERDFESALDFIEKSLVIEPDNPNTWNNKAVCLLNLNQYKDALVAVDKALSIDPKYPEAWINKGYLMAKLETSQEEEKSVVFISYCKVDGAIANEVCVNIEKSGINCWIAPRNIMPGKTWPDEIYRAIEQSELFLVLISRSSNNSSNVLSELNIANTLGKIIIPIRIQNFTPDGGMSYIVNTKQYFDIFDKNSCEYTPDIITKLTDILQNIQ